MSSALRRVFSGDGRITLWTVALVSVGVGVGAAMYVAVDSFVLRPVPFPHADRLAQLYLRGPHGGSLAVSPNIVSQWAASGVFEAVTAVSPNEVVIRDGAGDLRVVQAAAVSPNLFDVLEATPPLAGRTFDASDASGSHETRVIISERLWRSFYQSDVSVLSRNISIDNSPATIVGVMPAAVYFPSWSTQIWRAVDFSRIRPSDRSLRPQVYVKFRSGAARQSDLDRATSEAKAVDDGVNTLRATSRGIGDALVDEHQRQLFIILGVGSSLICFVLLMNVASLRLTSTWSRQDELAIKLALGASGWRLCREAASEALVLGLATGTVAALIGATLVESGRIILPPSLMVHTLHAPHWGPSRAAVTIAAVVIVTLVLSALPILVGRRVEAARCFRRGSVLTESAEKKNSLRALFVVEVALATAVLVVATLLVRSYAQLLILDRGFDDARVTTISLKATSADVKLGQEEVAAGTRKLQEVLPEVAGLQRLTWSVGIPGGAHNSLVSGPWQVELPGEVERQLEVEWYLVEPGFLEFYNIPIVRGRGVSVRDMRHEVVISETMGRELWGEADPVGSVFRNGADEFRVVGISKEVRVPLLGAESQRPEVYEVLAEVGRNVTFSARWRAPLPELESLQRRLASFLLPGVALRVESSSAAYEAQLVVPRTAAALGVVGALVAVAVAGSGIFALLTEAVRRRRRELGIRIAIGATGRDVVATLLREYFLLAAVGLTIGIWCVVTGIKLLAPLTYGVSLTDASEWLCVVGALGAVALAAALAPVLAALRIDPVVLIRSE